MLQAKLKEARRVVQCHLGHQFKDSALLARALTHPSAGSRNNERLEFLGDAVLNLIIGEALCDAAPEFREGQLSRCRASLVSNVAFAAVAREIQLGPALELGPGELKSGGRDRESILANAFEAVIAALYLEDGFETCRARVLALFAKRIEEVLNRPISKDPKTRLQEWLQARGLDIPQYSVLSRDGKAHRQLFVVQCDVADCALLTEGRGGSRRKAEQVAAKCALARLEASQADER